MGFVVRRDRCDPASSSIVRIPGALTTSKGLVPITDLICLFSCQELHKCQGHYDHKGGHNDHDVSTKIRCGLCGSS